MKLENFNEAFERMGDTKSEALNEALNESADRRQILAKQFDKLNNLKQIVTKSLTNVDVMRGMDKLQNYITVLEWILRLGREFVGLESADDRTFSTKMNYADHYIGQIANSLESGQLVHESLLKESLNYVCK